MHNLHGGIRLRTRLKLLPLPVLRIVQRRKKISRRCMHRGSQSIGGQSSSHESHCARGDVKIDALAKQVGGLLKTPARGILSAFSATAAAAIISPKDRRKALALWSFEHR